MHLAAKYIIIYNSVVLNKKAALKRVKVVENWVNDYFGEDYLSLYHFDDKRTKCETAFIINQLRKNILKEDIKILDLACGQGRHSLECAKNGVKVIGLDYQENLLSIAKNKEKKIKAENSDNNLSIDFIQGDMRALPFHCEFDAVINLFTAFGYFDDSTNSKVIGEVKKSLKNQGVFIQDLTNKNYLLANAKNYWERVTHDGLLVTNEWNFDHKSERYTHRQWLNKKDGTVREFSHTVRVYNKKEILDIYKNAGLEVINIFGDFSGNEYNENSSSRMILVSKKK